MQNFKNKFVFCGLIFVLALFSEMHGLASPTTDNGVVVTKDGVSYMQYHFASGRLAGEYPILMNVSHGVYYKWFENGQLRFIVPYLNGEITGAATIFNPQGKLIAQNSYYHNKLDGVSIYFYLSGFPKIIEIYKNGSLVGDPVEYDEKGNLLEKKGAPNK